MPNVSPSDLRTLRRLKTQGFQPETIYYVGDSSVQWPEALLRVCPGVRLYIFLRNSTPDPGISDLIRRYSQVRFHPATFGEVSGNAPAGVSGKEASLPIYTLDDCVREGALSLPQVVKIDCVGATSILRGGLKTVAAADIIFLTTSLTPSGGQPYPLLEEVTAVLEGSGFSLVELGEQHLDAQGRLRSIDTVFYSERLVAQVEQYNQPATSADRVRLSGELLRRLGKPESLLEINAGLVRDVDLIVSHAEINNKHGVGVLLDRLFGGRTDVLEIHSREMFGGETTFPARSKHLPHGSENGDEVYTSVLGALDGYDVKRVLCVPYFPDDIRTALAAKEVHNTPMCTFLMDDQNIFDKGIPDSLMKSLLERSALRLAISPDLRDAYETKYKMPFWYMPPVVTDRFIPTEVIAAPGNADPNAALMIGNVWGEQWLSRLRLTLRDSGVKVTWYSNAGFDDARYGREELEADSLFPAGSIPDDELIAVLRSRTFAIIPSGTLEPDDDRSFLARLSLPSRLIFMMATSHIPVIVLGHPDTAVARFVTRLGIGVTAPYRKQPFLDAVREINDPAINRAMRLRAHNVARKFSDKTAAEWIWNSLAKGEPMDSRFEDLLAPAPVAAAV